MGMVTRALFALLRRRIADRRAPDLVIGGAADPYLRRWYVLPRNPVLNVYLHHFLRSDDDRALHDHPWVNASVLLDGDYVEVLATRGYAGKQGRIVIVDEAEGGWGHILADEILILKPEAAPPQP